MILNQMKTVEPKSYWVVLLLRYNPVLFTLVFFAHLFIKSDDFTLFQGALSGLCGILTVMVCLHYIQRKDEELPFLPWIFIILYAYFCAPVFMLGEPYGGVTFAQMQLSGSITYSLLSVLLFMISVLIGFSFFPNVTIGRKKCDVAMVRPLSPILLYIISGLSIISNSTIYFLMANPPWYFTLTYTLFSTTFILLLWLYELKLNPIKIMRYGFFSYLLLSIGLAFITSRMSMVIMPIVIIMLVKLIQEKKVNLKLVGFIMIVMLVFNPIKHVYRTLADFGSGEIEQVGYSVIIDRWQQSFKLIWLGAEIESKFTDKQINKFKSGLSTRFNFLVILSAVHYKSPEIIPLDGGSTWLVAVSNLVPRMLWHDKANLTDRTNDYFNISFGFQNINQTSSTFAFPLITDAYWAFSWPGIIVAGLLLGLFAGSSCSLFSPSSRLTWVLPFYLMIVSRPTFCLADLLGTAIHVSVLTILVIAMLEFISRFKFNRPYH